jgi:hypothetical protein
MACEVVRGFGDIPLLKKFSEVRSWMEGWGRLVGGTEVEDHLFLVGRESVPSRFLVGRSGGESVDGVLKAGEVD